MKNETEEKVNRWIKIDSSFLVDSLKHCSDICYKASTREHKILVTVENSEMLISSTDLDKYVSYTCKVDSIDTFSFLLLPAEVRKIRLFLRRGESIEVCRDALDGFCIKTWNGWLTVKTQEVLTSGYPNTNKYLDEIENDFVSCYDLSIPKKNLIESCECKENKIQTEIKEKLEVLTSDLLDLITPLKEDNIRLSVYDDANIVLIKQGNFTGIAMIA